MWCLETIIRLNQEASDKWKKSQPKPEPKVEAPKRVKASA